MIRRRDFLINLMNSPVIANFNLTFMEASERLVREAAHKLGKTYKSITAASNNGMHSKYMKPIIAKAQDEAICAAIATDTTNSPNRLADEALKNNLRLYQQAI